jgi:2-pyrone-4,6-dicarboxylate lactonase
VRDTSTPTQPRMPRPPRRPLPPGACDTHAHVFGPLDRFPFKGPSNYAPPLADPSVYLAMLETIGAARGVLIQPAPYGTDPGALLNGLSGRLDRLRGISVATGDIADAELERLHAAGVRGLRFSEMRDPISGGRYKGGVGLEDYERLASRMKDLGWIPHIWTSCADLADMLPKALAFGLPFVVDHLAGVDVSAGTQDPSFRRIVALLKEGRIWIKLSVCRNSKRYWEFEDERPFHDALVAANPDRLLWGSDWPFVRMYENSPDVGQLIDLFDAWVSDDGIRQKVFVANPARLYGFLEA